MAAIDCYGYFVYDTSYAYIIGIYLEDPILSATLLTRISYFSVSVSPCSNCKKKNALKWAAKPIIEFPDYYDYFYQLIMYII